MWIKNIKNRHKKNKKVNKQRKEIDIKVKIKNQKDTRRKAKRNNTYRISCNDSCLNYLSNDKYQCSI